MDGARARLAWPFLRVVLLVLALWLAIAWASTPVSSPTTGRRPACAPRPRGGDAVPPWRWPASRSAAGAGGRWAHRERPGGRADRQHPDQRPALRWVVASWCSGCTMGTGTTKRSARTLA